MCEAPLERGALVRGFRGDVYCGACAELGEVAWVRELRGRVARARVYKERGRDGLVRAGYLVDAGEAPREGEIEEPRDAPPGTPQLYGEPKPRRPAADIAKSANGTLVVVLHRARGCIRCLQEIPRRKMALHGWAGVATCLPCARLDDLVFLRRGDALVTRRATRYSRRCAVVARWRRRYKRYERIGILAEVDAIARAKEEAALKSRRRS